MRVWVILQCEEALLRHDATSCKRVRVGSGWWPLEASLTTRSEVHYWQSQQHFDFPFLSHIFLFACGCFLELYMFCVDYVDMSEVSGGPRCLITCEIPPCEGALWAWALDFPLKHIQLFYRRMRQRNSILRILSLN